MWRDARRRPIRPSAPANSPGPASRPSSGSITSLSSNPRPCQVSKDLISPGRPPTSPTNTACTGTPSASQVGPHHRTHQSQPTITKNPARSPTYSETNLLKTSTKPTCKNGSTRTPAHLDHSSPQQPPAHIYSKSAKHPPASGSVASNGNTKSGDLIVTAGPPTCSPTKHNTTSYSKSNAIS